MPSDRLRELLPRLQRPGWWPPGLWPGGPRRPDPPGGLPERPRATAVGDAEPPASFLEAIRAAFGAGGVALYRLDRDGAAWILERRVGGDEAPPPGELAAAGHPLTWCLREDLLVQVTSDELLGGRAPGWSLAGAVPEADRALVVSFRGSPPAGAREGLEAAVEHLADLARAGVL